jgi:hypothetical protein
MCELLLDATFVEQDVERSAQQYAYCYYSRRFSCSLISYWVGAVVRACLWQGFPQSPSAKF